MDLLRPADPIGSAPGDGQGLSMAKRKKRPELTFQEHVADFLVRQHEYCVLEQSDITDTEHFIAEDQLWAFLKATQSETLRKLTDDYGTDARDEVFRALRKELAHTPLWMLFRDRLKVRGLEFHLFYPKPRSAESAAVGKYGENRITFRPHFYFGGTNQEIDFVFFLNGLPIVALELKHEKNQTVHDAFTQFAAPTTPARSFSIRSCISPPTPATRWPPPTRAASRTSAGITPD
jgi:type I restriction enzyme R subunit